MKPTGVVRRIDELGRIVIPKEIRRSLRIRDGESLEIFVEKDMVALKKYSSMSDLEDVAKQVTDSIYQALKVPILVTDRDSFIAVTGNLKKKYYGKSISNTLEKVLLEREMLLESNSSKIDLSNDVFEEGSYVMCPILVDGDSVGLVVMLSLERPIGELEEKVAQITAQFLGKHIEG